MRKNIFLAIAAAMETVTPSEAYPEGIVFVDLWNDQVNLLNGGSAFPIPAVFVEFEQIDWHQAQKRVRNGDIAVRLHIVTRAVPTHGHRDPAMPEALAAFDLIDSINAAMQALRGDNFAGFMLTTSATNHNHGELVENVERYVTRAQDTSAMRPMHRAAGLSISVNPPNL